MGHNHPEGDGQGGRALFHKVRHMSRSIFWKSKFAGVLLVEVAVNTYGEEHEAISCKNTGADSEGHNNDNDDAQDGLEDAKHCCPSGVIKNIWTTLGHCERCQPYQLLSRVVVDVSSLNTRPSELRSCFDAG